MLLALRPVHIELNRRSHCPNTAAAQYDQIAFCFTTALRHARYDLSASRLNDPGGRLQAASLYILFPSILSVQREFTSLISIRVMVW